jgi:hypothetical protein
MDGVYEVDSLRGGGDGLGCVIVRPLTEAVGDRKNVSGCLARRSFQATALGNNYLRSVDAAIDAA